MAKQSSPIIWIPKKVAVKDVKPTPNNYKIKTDLGKQRLAQSLKSFGMAGTVVVNTDLCLIDGNSRLEEAKEKNEKAIWVSMPNRKLTPKEFTEMSAMFDFAKAGEVDMERIKKELGTHKEFYERYSMEVPLELLAGLGGAPARSKNLQFPEEVDVAVEVNDIKMVQLFFNTKQEAEFRKLEEGLKKKLKVDNTTDCVLKAFRKLK